MIRTTIIAAFVLLAGAVWAPAQIPRGSEFRVDTRGFATPGFLFAAPRSSAMAPNGAFVIAWATSVAGASDVVARRFDAAGVGQGADFLVNTYTTGRQYNQSVGIDDAGNFVVVWMSHGQDGSSEGVFGQRFDASGTRRGAEFRVNATTLYSQRTPSVAVAPGGDFVVIWGSPDADSQGIFGQLYDASGLSIGAEFQVNSYTTGHQYVPTVDVDGAGNFVVVWGSPRYFGSFKAFGQRFSAGGVSQGTEFAVSSSTFGGQVRSRVARSRDGSFVVVWREAEVFARRFDASGTPLGANFQVNEQTTGIQGITEVDADADGDFVVTWTSYVTCCINSMGVFGRRFDSGCRWQRVYSHRPYDGISEGIHHCE